MDPVKPVRYPRPHPLSAGVARERDADLDPQIIWNGARIRLTKAQVRAAAGHGRGRDRRRAARLARQGPAGLVGPRGQRAAALHPGEGAPQGDHRRPGAALQGSARGEADDAPDLFADFNGLTDPEKRDRVLPARASTGRTA